VLAGPPPGQLHFGNRPAWVTCGAAATYTENLASNVTVTRQDHRHGLQHAKRGYYESGGYLQTNVTKAVTAGVSISVTVSRSNAENMGVKKWFRIVRFMGLRSLDYSSSTAVSSEPLFSAVCGYFHSLHKAVYRRETPLKRRLLCAKSLELQHLGQKV
jgi:hypothetical protein